MPIHFSIGFVAESRPLGQFEVVCAKAYVEQQVSAVACAVENVTAVWLREYGACK